MFAQQRVKVHLVVPSFSSHWPPPTIRSRRRSWKRLAIILDWAAMAGRHKQQRGSEKLCVPCSDDNTSTETEAPNGNFKPRSVVRLLTPLLCFTLAQSVIFPTTTNTNTSYLFCCCCCAGWSPHKFPSKAANDSQFYIPHRASGKLLLVCLLLTHYQDFCWLQIKHAQVQAPPLLIEP